MTSRDHLVNELGEYLKWSGPAWSERIEPDQQPLVRQMALTAAGHGFTADLEALTAWLAGERVPAGPRSWALSEKSVGIQGPAGWGYVTHVFQPTTAIPATAAGYLQNVVSAGVDRVFALRDGSLLEIPAGGGLQTVIQEGILTVMFNDASQVLLVAPSLGLLVGPTATENVDVELTDETVWFVRKPQNFRPLSLLTAGGEELYEGTAYRCSDNWIALRSDPRELWPDGIAHAGAVELELPCANHRMLRSDSMFSRGDRVARYLKHNQSAWCFEKAIAELAGLYVCPYDTVITGAHERGSTSLHFTADGGAFTLSASPYVTGSRLRGGEIAGGGIHLRCRALQGPDWWKNRPWGAAGISVADVRPGTSGFWFRDALAEAMAVRDSVDATKLRAVLDTEGPSAAASPFWIWQHAAERSAGTETLARSTLGFTAEGQSKTVNALGLLADILGDRLWVVEYKSQHVRGSLVTDFVDREKPAGVIVLAVAV